MLAQLLRWSVLLTLWKRYQKQCLALLLLVGAWLLIGVLHQDFIEYARLTQTEEGPSIAWSFLIKWALNIGLLLTFIFYVKVSNKKHKVKSPLHQQLAASDNGNTSSADTQSETQGDQQDAFAKIRIKPKLRSKGDVIIEKSNRPKH